MLRERDLRLWVDRLGVPEQQVRRDHLVSVILLAVPDILPDGIFFGGTALCRTHLPHWRLSEDIDLLVGSRGSARGEIGERLPRALRREYPELELSWLRLDGTEVASARSEDLVVQIQLVARDPSYARYPTAEMDVLLRYADLPPTVPIACPTLTGATAMKLNAWADRGTARDLCDLFALAQIDAITVEALDIAAETSRPLQPYAFDEERLPSEAQWSAALGHQMREPPPPHQALDLVRSAVADRAGWQ